MDVIKVVPIAVALGMDAMSVSMAVGVRWHGSRQRFRLAWHMGLFQFMMPLLGWLVGRQFAELLRDVGSYLAAAMVFAVAAKMLYEAVKAQPGRLEQRGGQAMTDALHLKRRDPTRGWSLVMLSIATSLDALVIGFSLALRADGTIWLASGVIGLTAGVMSLMGMAVGKRAGQALGRPAELLGALVLMAVAVSFLLV